MKKETITKFYFRYSKFYFRYRLYIFPAIVALSSLFLIIFALYPQTAKLIENQRVAGDLTNKSKFLATKVTALESYSAEDLSRKVGIALDAFPADQDYGNVLGLLQGVAAQSGFTISSITFGNTPSKLGNASSFTIRLEIKGLRSLFQSFLTNLENSPRIMRVSSVDISFTQASETFDGAMGLEVLYSPAPQTFGTVDSPLPSLSQKEEELLVTLSSSRTALTVSPSVAQPSQGGKANPFE